MSIPLAISWALTMFAYSVEMIYATACAAGFCSSIIQLATQVGLLLKLESMRVLDGKNKFFTSKMHFDYVL